MRDLEVFARESEERLGNVVNLSRSGMMITHANGIAVGSMQEFKIPLGHVISGLSDFEADVRVKWIRDNHESGLCDTGLEFLDKTKEQWALIQVMIDVFEFSWV